jgi:hypothetical protein
MLMVFVMCVVRANFGVAGWEGLRVSNGVKGEEVPGLGWKGMVLLANRKKPCSVIPSFSGVPRNFLAFENAANASRMEHWKGAIS